VRIETLCTGDELLTGLTADTNSRFFQTQLLERLGLQVRRSTVVGDVRDDIVEALQTISTRADVLLVSGGLGPTADDFTAECAAIAASAPLEERPEVVAHITERIARRGFKLTANNLRQAMVPRGAEVVLNPVGSAPMFGLTLGRCRCYFVPGVPREYRHLVEHEVLPRLIKAAPPHEARVLRLLKTIGLPESHLDEKVAPLALKHPKVVFGFRTELPENHLKLLGLGVDEAQARAVVAAAEADCRAVLGAHVFAVDQETMASVVLSRLEARKETLALAESLTGGRVASQLTAVPGASKVLLGAAVTYGGGAKQRWAQVPAGLLSAHGAVSAEVAQAMAAGVREELQATWGVATTGLAGPTGDGRQAVGTVFVAVAGPSSGRAERHLFTIGGRDGVQALAAHAALDLLRRTLQTGEEGSP